MSSKLIKRLNNFVIVMALGVVMLGAYTRLTDAGLGCPDWPGCYGQFVVLPLQHAQDFIKAWTEMAHRYAAGTLVSLIVILLISILRSTLRTPLTQRVSLLLFGLLGFQAALGMWTVTLKLLPIVVMGHLLGGILIFSSLIYLRAAISTLQPKANTLWRMMVNLGLVIVSLQIALGGWVSANYAGIACVGFPQCNGHWLPAMDWTHAFQLFSPLNENYQGGLLSHPARVTIQVAHRVGALITLLYLLTLSIVYTQRAPNKAQQRVAALLGVLVIAQCTLGITNVVYFLPLPVAVLHNGVAALLLANLVTLRYLTGKYKP
jgi:cytochrome c oxidase assembly protein subunit 15